MVGVFVPKETDALFSFHFNKCSIKDVVTVYNDVEQFKSSRHDYKVACFQMPYPVQDAFNATLKEFANCSDHVLVLMSELHNRTVQFIQNNDDKRISYFICGELNFDTEHSAIHKFYDWFTTTVHVYKHERPMLLEQSLQHHCTKPKYFDVLLGRKKHHRDIAYRRVNKDHNIVTYLDTVDNDAKDFNDLTKWRWPAAGLTIPDRVEWTVDVVNYEGHRMSLSQIVPIDVYNESAYSLVAETNYDNHYTFYTEKTVKPILGKRLFVCLSGQYALKNLQKIGFKTFGSVIDESYDDVEDWALRCNRALDQVDYLSTQNQEHVLEQIKPICEYNHSVMMSTNWYETYFMPSFVSYFINQ
jgi:hypothetical protein